MLLLHLTTVLVNLVLIILTYTLFTFLSPLMNKAMFTRTCSLSRVRMSRCSTVSQSVGVSNHTQEHLQALIDGTGVVPAANQIERHPRLLQSNFIKWCATRNIHITEYSAFGNNMFSEPLLIQHKIIKEIADRLGATPAQVILAWAQVGGHSVIPKSVTVSRIRENFQEIELSEDDFKKIEQIGIDEPRRFNIPYIANTPRWPVNIFGSAEEESAPHKVIL
jgi:L-glyceraldehyde reductase